MAYPFAAFLTGWLAERGFDRRYLSAMVAMICGLVVVYAGGVGWLMMASTRLGFAAALAAGFYPFVLADLAKLLVASGVMPALWTVIGRAQRRL
jgi:biotin transport system substrate-specific component